jgi:DNA-binding MarR family transcriptional regulator
MEFLAAEGWPTIEAQSVRALLEVALNPDVTMTELIKRLNISGAAVSRNIDFLGDGKIGTPGAKWVEVNVDPHDRRMKRVRLTAKGRSVMNKLAEELRSYR